MIQQLKEREPGIKLNHYVNKETQEIIRDELKVPDFINEEKCSSESGEDQQFDEVGYSYAMKRRFQNDSRGFDERNFEEI